MIVSTIGDLIKALKKYPKSAHKEVVGMVWYRKVYFKDDVENRKFLTDDIFEDALEYVDDTQADEYISNQIINRLQELEEEEKEANKEEEETAAEKKKGTKEFLAWKRENKIP